MTKHILKTDYAHDGSEIQIQIFDDSSNQISWIKISSQDAKKSADFKKTE